MKDKKRFNIGDRVTLSRDFTELAQRRFFPDDTGTVVGRSSDERAGVRFDRNIDGHTLGHRCPDGYGWWIEDRWLRPAQPPAPPADLCELF